MLARRDAATASKDEKMSVHAEPKRGQGNFILHTSYFRLQPSVDLWGAIAPRLFYLFKGKGWIFIVSSRSIKSGDLRFAAALRYRTSARALAFAGRL
jgi:hypothetical protein